RLLAHHHLARLGGGDRDLAVGVVGARDIDEVDVFRLHYLAPIGHGVFEAPVLGEAFAALRVARAYRLQHRLIRQFEKIAGRAERVGMGASHEPIPDDAYVEFFHRLNSTRAPRG